MLQFNNVSILQNGTAGKLNENRILMCSFTTRTLRNQNRIRLHIHMFSSFMVYAVIIVLWETLVVYDRVWNAGGSTVMGSNSV